MKHHASTSSVEIFGKGFIYSGGTGLEIVVVSRTSLKHLIVDICDVSFNFTCITSDELKNFSFQ